MTRTAARLLLLVLIVGAIGCAGHRQAGLELPDFQPLPEVTFVAGEGGTVCTASAADTNNLARREELRQAREDALLALLEAEGYE